MMCLSKVLFDMFIGYYNVFLYKLRIIFFVIFCGLFGVYILVNVVVVRWLRLFFWIFKFDKCCGILIFKDNVFIVLIVVFVVFFLVMLVEYIFIVLVILIYLLRVVGVLNFIIMGNNRVLVILWGILKIVFNGCVILCIIFKFIFEKVIFVIYWVIVILLCVFVFDGFLMVVIR